MTREYLPYAVIETAFVFTDHRYLLLPPTGKLVYLTLWCRSFNERRATLKPPFSLPRAIARDTGADPRTVSKMLQKCHDSKLIKKHRNGDITVIGVHGKGNLSWKDDDDTGQKSPQKRGQRIDKTRQEIEIEIENEIKGERTAPPWVMFLQKYPDATWGNKTTRCVAEDGSLTAIGERIVEAFKRMGVTVEQAAADFKRRPYAATKRGDAKFCSDLLTSYADELATSAGEHERAKRVAKERKGE